MTLIILLSTLFLGIILIFIAFILSDINDTLGKENDLHEDLEFIEREMTSDIRIFRDVTIENNRMFNKRLEELTEMVIKNTKDMEYVLNLPPGQRVK